LETALPAPRSAPDNPTHGLTPIRGDHDVVVTGQEHHQDALSPYAPLADGTDRRIVVELVLAPIRRGSHAGELGIEVLLDGQRIGELNHDNAQRYSPFLVEVLRRGGRPSCMGLVRDDRGLEVVLQLPDLRSQVPPATVVIPSPRGESPVVRPRPYSPPLSPNDPTLVTAYGPPSPQDDPTVVITPVPDEPAAPEPPPTVVAPAGHGLRIATPTGALSVFRHKRRTLLLVGAGVVALIAATVASTSGGSSDEPADAVLAAPPSSTSAAAPPFVAPALPSVDPAPTTDGAAPPPSTRGGEPSSSQPRPASRSHEELVAEAPTEDCDPSGCGSDDEGEDCAGGQGNADPRGAARGLDRDKDGRDCEED
jgi:hypothetical protein